MEMIIYFSSREDFKNPKTWKKEIVLNGFTVEEVREAARLAGQEGFALTKDLEVYYLEWFVKQ